MSVKTQKFKLVSTRQGSSILIVKKAILLISIVICLTIFLLTNIANTGFNSARRSFKAEKQDRTLKTISQLNFDKINLTEIKNTEELIKNLILTFKPEDETLKKRIYLRCCSFETFTSRAMKSRLKELESKGWPDFALANLPAYIDCKSYKGNLTFFSEFGFMLPAPDVLTGVTAPVGYKPMKDARLALSHSILEADQFKVRWIKPQVPYSLIKDVPAQSFYLQLEHIAPEVLQEFVTQFSGKTFTRIKDLKPLIDYFENEATYKTDVDKIEGIHPVEQFLSEGMKGHCQHIAASFVAVCRYLKIPARVSAGFTSDFYSEKKFIVVESMAHAWPEVLTSSGWVKVDISVKKSEAPNIISKEALAKIKQDLAQALEQRQKELLKNASGTKRVKNKDLENQNLENTPDNIEAEAADKSASNKNSRGSFLKNLLLFFAILTLLTPVIKYFDKIVAFITKLFKNKKKNETKEETEKQLEIAQDNFNEFIEKQNDFELSGKDATELFNRFLNVVALKSGPVRLEQETAHEYLKRFCKHFDLPPDKGLKASRFLEAELYGEKQFSKESFNEYANLLKTLLERIN